MKRLENIIGLIAITLLTPATLSFCYAMIYLPWFRNSVIIIAATGLLYCVGMIYFPEIFIPKKRDKK